MACRSKFLSTFIPDDTLVKGPAAYSEQTKGITSNALRANRVRRARIFLAATVWEERIQKLIDKRKLNRKDGVGAKNKMNMCASHPLDQLSASEIKAACTAVQQCLAQLPYSSEVKPCTSQALRFNVITLAEPPKRELLAFISNGKNQVGDEKEAAPRPQRRAQVIFMVPSSGAAYEAIVELTHGDDKGAELKGDISNCEILPAGSQPLLTPDDCNLAERIVKADEGIATLLKERYGIINLGETVNHMVLFIPVFRHILFYCRSDTSQIRKVHTKDPWG